MQNPGHVGLSGGTVAPLRHPARGEDASGALNFLLTNAPALSVPRSIRLLLILVRSSHVLPSGYSGAGPG